MEILSKTTEDTKKLAERLSGVLEPGAVIALSGDLGGGKTTFTGFLVAALGFESRVQSPTFVIIRHYKREFGDIKYINHIDLYRMTSKEEVMDLGLAEMFVEPETITLIEWPNLIESELPKDTIRIYFDYMGETERKINVQNLH